jgi:hypothetical protein
MPDSVPPISQSVIVVSHHDPAKPETGRAERIIRRLWDRPPGLPTFFAAFPNEQRAKDNMGNCHEVCEAILVDLFAAGLGCDWAIVTGICDFEGFSYVHSWLEFDRWTVDAVKGTLRFMPWDIFSAATNPREVKAFELSEAGPWKAHRDFLYALFD